MSTPSQDSRERFSGRADDYVRARPGYPQLLVDHLASAGALFPGATVVDIGSGTGISSELFLAAGYPVVGVEPNAAMRAAAESALTRYPRFQSVAGTAEATGLPPASIDLAVAAQAFHWFDGARARTEIERILRPAGWVALIWNARRSNGTPFLEDYEALLQEFGTDYAQVGHRGVSGERLAGFFRAPNETRCYDNAQELDKAGLRSRLLSSSYIPDSRSPRHAAMLQRLEELFEAHAEQGHVRILYDTQVHAGRLTPG